MARTMVQRLINGDVVSDPNGIRGVVERVEGRQAVVAYGLRQTIRLTWTIASLRLDETFPRLGRKTD